MIFKELLKKIDAGNKVGITSVCSANNFVIEAAMLHAKENNYKLLIESTSNQVDQFGGYTGMTPEKFYSYVSSIAKKTEFPFENLVLGGDHLGPNVWKNQNYDVAIKNTADQVAAYVSAGYTKIHLDSSFALADDNTIDGVLSPEIITDRAALMCEIAENTSKKNNLKSKPIYVIGTDVPIPGGAVENEEEVKLTTASELEETIQLSKKAFYKRGLEEAWERVVAVVVQPGVEFSDSKVLPYKREKNKELIDKIKSYNNLYLEAHSTDYQSKVALRQMVEDSFAILKVGPWLTFALREALYSLANIEDELLKYRSEFNPSNLLFVLETEMNANPKYWKNHYHGNENEISIARSFSYSDRIRYYWSNQNVNDSVNRLIGNLNKIDIPESLISQFLPFQYSKLRNGEIKNNAKDFVISKISEVLSIYYSATGGISEK